MSLRKILISICLLITCASFTKPPEITSKDAKNKIEEIFKAHVKHKEMSNQLIERALGNYLSELDPLKTYFLAPEIESWSTPSDETLEEIALDFKSDNFDQFEKIYHTMMTAVKRRNILETKLDSMPLPKKCDPKQFKDMDWAQTEDELINRLLILRSLQLEAGDTLDEDSNALLQKQIKKRRLRKEADIVELSKKERQAQNLSYVLKAYASALDSHTAYLTPQEASQFMIQVQQKLYGIGALLRDDISGFSIMKLIEGGPALLSSKLKCGDKIIAVNGQPVAGLDLIEAVDMIRGPRGSKVKLTILRETHHEAEPSQTLKFDIDITRDEIVLKESRYEPSIEPYGNGVIAHIKLFSFYQDKNSSSAKDIQNSIEEIKRKHNLLGVVLDLRGNGGGVLGQAVAVSGLFIKKGIVVSIKDSSERIQHLRNFDSAIAWDGPLIVLTNKASASAAEIVAQSLQDYGRALVVGDERTFGKGSYQSLTLEAANPPKINPQGEYKVTRGIYYTVSGKSPQLNGVQSDIVIPGLYSEMEVGEIHAKYPLEGDRIKENFDDDLSDIHPIHRGKMKRLYKTEIQPKVNMYGHLEPILKNNSQKRIELNQNYQNFLTELKKKDSTVETMESFGQNDLQLEETFNVMKDLIFMNNKQPSEKLEALKE